MKKFLCTWFGEVCYSCSLTVLPGPAWVVLIYVLQGIFFHLCTSVWMHVTWQFLSPVATQVNGMHENWKWSKNDILWRKDLNASAAPLCPKIMYARTWNCQIRHLKKGCPNWQDTPLPHVRIFLLFKYPPPPLQCGRPLCMVPKRLRAANIAVNCAQVPSGFTCLGKSASCLPCGQDTQRLAWDFRGHRLEVQWNGMACQVWRRKLETSGLKADHCIPHGNF